MTIAVGILTQAQGAVVIAADTQESSGSTKGNTPKILTGLTADKSGAGCIAVTGAGDSNYLDCAKQEIVGLFLDHCRAGSVAKFDGALKKYVRDFHIQHVIPFAKFPDYERPAIALVVGVSHPNFVRLWETDRTTVKHSIPYARVGIGSSHAKTMLDRFSVAWTDVNVARIIAAYVIWSTKLHVDQCGGMTHVVTVRGDVPAYLPDDIIQEMEKLFSSYDGIEARAFYYGIGLASPNAASDMNKLSSWLDSLRNEFMQLAARM